MRCRVEQVADLGKSVELYDGTDVRNRKRAQIDSSGIIRAKQKIFQKNGNDGQSKFVWIIEELRDYLTTSLYLNAALYSDIVTLCDGTTWQFKFIPHADTMGCYSQIFLIAYPNAREAAKKEMKRRVEINFGYYSGSKECNKNSNWSIFSNFTMDSREKGVDNFLRIRQDRFPLLGLDQSLPLTVSVRPEVYFEPNRDQELLSASKKRKAPLRAKTDKYIGLYNEGTTCYLNSLLQSLFINREFRRAVYKMPTDLKDHASIPFCLQRIFYNL